MCYIKKNKKKQTLSGKKPNEGVAGERIHASLLYIIALSTSLVSSSRHVSSIVEEGWAFSLSRLEKLIGNKGDNYGVTSNM